MVRRVRPEIVVEILEKINLENSRGRRSKKTNIMSDVGMSFTDAKKYLNFLQENSFVSGYSQGELGYIITPEGQDYLGKIKLAVEVTKSLHNLR